MNPKTVLLIVLVTALATAICSASRGSDEDMPYRQLLRELRKKGTDMRKKGTDMRRKFGEAVNVMSKREEDCDVLYKPCSASSECTPYTCDGVQLDCYSYGQGQRCEPDESSSYRR